MLAATERFAFGRILLIYFQYLLYFIF